MPRFDEQPHDVTLYPGQTAYFPCSIQGQPPAEITWIKDDRALRIEGDDRMTLLPSGALEIRRVQTSDSGTFKCNASNAERHRISSTGTLTVSLDYGKQISSILDSILSRLIDYGFVLLLNVHTVFNLSA